MILWIIELIIENVSWRRRFTDDKMIWREGLLQFLQFITNLLRSYYEFITNLLQIYSSVIYLLFTHGLKIFFSSARFSSVCLSSLDSVFRHDFDWNKPFINLFYFKNSFYFP